MGTFQRFEYKIDTFLNNDALSFYLLGAFYTDGSMTKRKQFAMCSNDKDWLCSIKNAICPQIKIVQSLNTFRIYFNNQIMYDWLHIHGCVQNKSLILEMPKVPEKYLFDFVRGIIDGDGTIGLYTFSNKYKNKNGEIKYSPYKRGTMTIYSASKNFLLSLQSCLTKVDMRSTFHEMKARKKNAVIGNQVIHQKNPLYTLQTSGKNCSNLLNKCYTDPCMALQRKQFRAEQIINHYN